jgi:hypothetical protein
MSEQSERDRSDIEFSTFLSDCSNSLNSEVMSKRDSLGWEGVLWSED